MDRLKHEHRFLYDKISDKDITKAIEYLHMTSTLSYNFKWLSSFDSWGKWNALLFMMKHHFSGELISKTDIAKEVTGMSRDGALKWIDSLIDQELLFQHHDPSVKRDKRKFYIIPHREITVDFHEYTRERILLATKNVDKFQIDDTVIGADIITMTDRVKTNSK